MKKENYIVKIKVITGLHIGVGDDKPEIGGIDNQFIKDPVSKLPYIPGSSIKGKLRCLLETESETYNTKYEKNQKTNKEEEKIHPDVLKAFGGGEGPTRLIFRDLILIDSFREKFMNAEIETEVKTEININRKTGTTVNTALRTTERIPPTTEFEGEILIRYNDENELKKITDILDEAIELLNNDYLGGSGSRGYGAVEVTLIKRKKKESKTEESN